MTDKPKIYADQIAKNSNAAECVRQADEVLQSLIDELQTVSEVLSDPYKTSSHLMRSMHLAHEVKKKLGDTGIPKYRQEPLFPARNPGALR